MARVVVRSRSGNVVLAVLGIVYALSAIVILIALTTEAWNAAAIIDRAIQLSLLASAACGVWFVVIALENLGIRFSRRGLPHFQRRSPGVR